MYIIVRPCGMVLVSMTCLVSVMNAVLLDMMFFCFLLNVTRLSLYKSGEKRESSMLLFRTRDKQTPSTKMCPPVPENTDAQRSHSALVND